MTKPLNKLMIISVLSIIVLVLLAFGALAMGGLVVTVSNAPLPLNSSPEAEYKMPENLPGKSGGPFLSSREIEEISVDVAKTRGEISPNIKDIVMTTHGLLIEEGVFSPSYSVANDREVYLVTLSGEFTFTRVRPGADPIKATHVNIEIDATTGDVLAVGTSTATKDKDVLQRLKMATQR